MPKRATWQQHTVAQICAYRTCLQVLHFFCPYGWYLGRTMVRKGSGQRYCMRRNAKQVPGLTQHTATGRAGLGENGDGGPAFRVTHLLFPVSSLFSLTFLPPDSPVLSLLASRHFSGQATWEQRGSRHSR